MLYERRQRMTSQLLKKAAIGNESIIVFGSGVWFTALERMLARKVCDYSKYVGLMQLVPVFRASFVGNGVIQCIDLKTRQNMSLIENGTAQPPDIAYLVEDVPGDNAEVWDDIIRPFLYDSDTSVVYIGTGQDEYIKKH